MTGERKRCLLIAAAGLVLVVLCAVIPESWLRLAYNLSVGRFFRHSVESRLKAIEPKMHIVRIPEKLVIAAFKREKIVELWGDGKLIKRCVILAASGKTGPKLREGDRQVPEGFYKVESLYPNSYFYLALKIAYPSEEDKAAAIAEKRDVANLGSAIMLHGRGGSVGCIAVSNEDVEEIFYLTAKAGTENTSLLICPYDFRKNPVPADTAPAWLLDRYRRLADALSQFTD